ncbi:hypothetical protein BDQ17DRAFT_1367317 [Cyathus striatus]|nr:hypothetical protein BDQ17DRAFT_1367317 [Cyathus striatus]
MKGCYVLSTSCFSFLLFFTVYRGVGSQFPFLSSSLSVSVLWKKANEISVDYLATDHPMIRCAVMEQGYMETLALLVKSITPDGVAGKRGKRECQFGRMRVWVLLSCVRFVLFCFSERIGITDISPRFPLPSPTPHILTPQQAALTTLATLPLFDNKPCAFLTSTTPSLSPTPSTAPDKPPFLPQGISINILPLLSVSLTNPHAGVRTATCQCTRALSRAVESLRTRVIDSGLVMRVWEVVLDEW